MVLKLALNKIFVALQDSVQMEAIRSKWEEIKKLNQGFNNPVASIAS